MPSRGNRSRSLSDNWVAEIPIHSSSAGTGLHHRTPLKDEARKTSSPYQDNDGVSFTPKRRHVRRKHHSLSTKHIIAGIFVIYSILAIRIYQRLRRNQPSSDPTMESFGNSQTRLLLQRHLQDEAESQIQQSMQIEIRKRHRQRRDLIQQKDIPKLPNHTLDPRSTKATPTETQLANLQQLCGFHAQNASLTYPDAFLTQDALKEDSRVAIIGILHPVATHLAYIIEHRCKAKVVFATDLMYPTSQEHKLQLLPQITRLSRHLSLERPILHSFFTVDSDKKHYDGEVLPETGEMDIMQYDPTHIVFIGHFNQSEPFQYSSQTATLEQILTSVAKSDRKPHITYHATQSSKDSMNVQAISYQELFGTQANGFEMSPETYGPLARSRVDETIRSFLTNETRTSALIESPVYIHDIAEGILTAMQFRHPERKPVHFSFTSKQVVDTSAISNFLSNTSSPLQTNGALSLSGDSDNRLIDWTPFTTLSKGIKRSLQWNYEQLFPYNRGPSSNNTDVKSEIGHFASIAGEESCQVDDIVCHLGRPSFPCISECSSSHVCKDSVFDTIVQLTRDLTEGCDVVLYTQEFDPEATSIKMNAEYSEEGSPTICNFAFVNRQSKLVDAAVQKVPKDDLIKLGALPRPEDDGNNNVLHERAVAKLNGRLLLRGWILIWPTTDVSNISHADEFLLKLSPTKLFHPDVKYSMFVEENISLSPTIEDVRFLVHELSRQPFEARVAKRKTKPVVKVRLPPEPGRRAALLVPQLRLEDSSGLHTLLPDTRLSIRKAVQYMRYENGEIPESDAIRAQTGFYERLHILMNKKVSARSASDRLYQYRLKQWARTRWVVHDLYLEGSRDFRCDWYEEHLTWGSSLDQLSLAQVMTRRQFSLRLTNDAVDDEMLAKMKEELDAVKIGSDAHEWFPLTYNREVDESVMLANLYGPNIEATNILRNVAINPFKNTELPYIRIISDRILSGSRKAWAKMRDLQTPKPAVTKPDTGT